MYLMETNWEKSQVLVQHVALLFYKYSIDGAIDLAFFSKKYLLIEN